MIKKYKKTISALLILSVFLVLLTLSVSAQELTYPEIPGAETPTEETKLPGYIKYIFNFAIILGAILAFAALLFGGIRWFLSVGSPSAISEAKSWMLAGIIGVVLLLSSYLILTTINPELAILKLEELEEFEPVEPPEYTPPEIETTYYQEIPIGLLIENILAKNIDCYDYSKDPPEILLDHDRLDCIKILVETIKTKSEKLKNLAEELLFLYKKCNCFYCEKGDCNCAKTKNEDGEESCVCVSNCHCKGDPCPDRARIIAIKKEVGIIVEELKILWEKLIVMKDELQIDLNYLKDAEELAKFPYGQRISLAKYHEKKPNEKIDKVLFQNFDISEYCRTFNCISPDPENPEICLEYGLNPEGKLCNTYNLDGEPATLYFPEQEYE